MMDIHKLLLLSDLVMLRMDTTRMEESQGPVGPRQNMASSSSNAHSHVWKRKARARRITPTANNCPPTVPQPASDCIAAAGSSRAHGDGRPRSDEFAGQGAPVGNEHYSLEYAPSRHIQMGLANATGLFNV